LEISDSSSSKPADSADEPTESWQETA